MLGPSPPATAFRLHQHSTVIVKNSFSPIALLACYPWGDRTKSYGCSARAMARSTILHSRPAAGLLEGEGGAPTAPRAISSDTPLPTDPEHVIPDDGAIDRIKRSANEFRRYCRRPVFSQAKRAFAR
jgi:hypothetical protein